MILAVALLISVLLKQFLVQTFSIPSGSMEDTLQRSDRVLVNKLVDEPDEVRRGDVVVFRDPGGWLYQGARRGGPAAVLRDALAYVGLAPPATGSHLIKRVIGVGGDTVACCTDGRLTVNGVALREPYRFPGDEASQVTFEVEVPQDRLWVMGDHRSNSSDSRAHMGQPGGGFVPVDLVVGRAFVIAWPPGRVAWLDRPAAFEVPRLARTPGDGS